MLANTYDKAGRALEAYEDVAGVTPAVITSVSIYDAAGRTLTVKD